MGAPGNLFRMCLLLLFILCGDMLINFVTAESTQNSMWDSVNGTLEIEDDDFVRFLEIVRVEKNYTTFVVLTNEKDNCVNLQGLMEDVPLLLLNEHQSHVIKENFNTEMLVVVCVRQQRQRNTELLEALSTNLDDRRGTRIIFRLTPENERKDVAVYMEELFRYCQDQQMLNVIAVLQHFPTLDNQFYTYTRFPSFRVMMRDFAANVTIFPNRLLNLHGYPIRTLVDQVQPRTILYFDQQGELRIIGYVGNFINLFAKHLNASLALTGPLEFGKAMFYHDVLNFTRNNTVDIPTSISAPYYRTQWKETSYPYELAKLCLMLPMEEELTMAEIYLVITNMYFVGSFLLTLYGFSMLLLIAIYRMKRHCFQLTWLDLALNDKAFRGVLGQSFAFNYKSLDYFVKYVLFLLFVTGLVVTTLYGVFLGSYMTHPPLKHRINTVDDLVRSPLKLLISNGEYHFLTPEERAPYESVFQIAKSLDEFMAIRHSLNPSFAYMLPSSRWPMYKSQQELFSRQLVRYADHLCLQNFNYLSIFLPENSIYEDELNRAILRVHDVGLFNFWYFSAFRELVSVGYMSYTDWTQPRVLRPMTLDDVKNVYVCYTVALMFSVSVFVVELGYWRWKENFDCSLQSNLDVL